MLFLTIETPKKYEGTLRGGVDQCVGGGALIGVILT